MISRKAGKPAGTLFDDIVRVGFECPNCGEHHVTETTRAGFIYRQCPTFPLLGWLRLDVFGEGKP